MKFRNTIGIYFTIVLSIFILSCSEQSQPVLQLWYEQPAVEWMQSTPIGNGRLGAMVYGGIKNEKLALNEITMWSGQFDENQELACGKEKLAEIRKLFFEGKLIEGNAMAAQYLSGQPHSFGTHLPVGDLHFNFSYPSDDIKSYKRMLDIENAISTVTFTAGDVNYKREYFCSNPDNIVAAKFSADKKNALNFDIRLNLLHGVTIETHNNELTFSGEVDFPKQGAGGVNFYGKIKVITSGGELRVEHHALKVENSDEAIIWIDIRTDYKNADYRLTCDNTISEVSEKQYEEVKQKHIEDYSNLFSRVELCLGNSETENLPTDKRWELVRQGKQDVGLDALFFQYGRYLLISSSRENSPLPANLQGVWNDDLACNMPWTCDYHLDINTEQNYWAANITNLAECNVPLFNYIEDLSVWGENTAQKVYGSPGWVAHTVANVWGYTAPGQSVTWGAFPCAGVWMASHLWEHYLYTGDKKFLKEKAYPILKGAALFFQDYLVEHPENGYMMTGPCNSPENSFFFEGQELALSMMPTGDRIFLHELYTACIKSAEILGIDADFAQELKQTKSKFPPLQIGRNGELQEWLEDYESAHPNHRHATHLLCLYPYSQITLDQTPELCKAALLAIENKLSSEGWEDVEFCRAMMIAFYARLHKAEEAYKSLNILHSKLMRENLLTMSVAGIASAEEDIFIFDGNEAATAAMAEMLIQNHQGYIDFLPALPAAWNTGRFKGLCIKGGGIVDLEWKNGVVEYAKITASIDNRFSIKLSRQASALKVMKNGKPQSVDYSQNEIMTVDLKKGEYIELK